MISEINPYNFWKSSLPSGFSPSPVKLPPKKILQRSKGRSKVATPQISRCWWISNLGDMGVEPKIGGFYPPKWMVYFMENPMNKWIIWGYHYFRKHPHGESCWVVYNQWIVSLLLESVKFFGTSNFNLLDDDGSADRESAWLATNPMNHLA